jgi:RPE4 domain-containing protein
LVNDKTVIPFLKNRHPAAQKLSSRGLTAGSSKAGPIQMTQDTAIKSRYDTDGQNALAK